MLLFVFFLFSFQVVNDFYVVKLFEVIKVKENTEKMMKGVIGVYKKDTRRNGYTTKHFSTQTLAILQIVPTRVSKK